MLIQGGTASSLDEASDRAQRDIISAFERAVRTVTPFVMDLNIDDILDYAKMQTVVVLQNVSVMMENAEIQVPRALTAHVCRQHHRFSFEKIDINILKVNLKNQG
uniref:Uncharacterized protein n=1 Tax=Acrobeloides nanus TaxID=290746 RepID=A0A914BX79_9BILA